jgi:hypothetical protein
MPIALALVVELLAFVGAGIRCREFAIGLRLRGEERERWQRDLGSGSRVGLRRPGREGAAPGIVAARKRHCGQGNAETASKHSHVVTRYMHYRTEQSAADTNSRNEQTLQRSNASEFGAQPHEIATARGVSVLERYWRE